MNAQIIKPQSIDFKTLVNNNNKNCLSLNFKTKIVNTLNETFTKSEEQWYIANLYVYLNYHPTNDYPINLDNIFSMIGFASKGNAKRTLRNNFTENEDYKVLLSTKDKKDHGGHNEETIILNFDTFKNLCMMAKTATQVELRSSSLRSLMIIFIKKLNKNYLNVNL